jgi:1,4-alpha-glucan branching enzyme
MTGGPVTYQDMGARVHAGGVTFRVWAPHADVVSVAGDFNAWSPDANPLTADSTGYWYGDIAEAELGHRYKFVLRAGGVTLWRNDPYARLVTHSAGDSIVTDSMFDWGNVGYRTPAWNEMVIYEIHVGTFNDAPGGRPGSFASVASRLDYLRDLGVNCIELMPSAEFATDFSWGYNPAHIFAVESAFGGPEALKDLIRAAHERGIAVILDVVYNHLGPSDLDLWQFDGWSENDRGGIYFYNDWRCQTSWGHTRPDYGRPEVCQFLADNARYWLEDFRVDGLRWDATAFIRNVYGNDDPDHDIPDGWRLMQRINDETDQRQPWKLQIAEDLRNNSWITTATAAGGAGFDTQWDASFVHPVRWVLTQAADGGRSMAAVRSAILGGDVGTVRRVIYTESHDEVTSGHARLPEEIAPGDAANVYAKKRSTLGATLVMTAPGIPMIFQGQEILEDQWFHDDDPIDWTKEDTYAGIQSLYRDLIHLRRNWHDTTRGLQGHRVNVYHVNDDNNVVAFHRWDRGGPGDDVVVVVNVANQRHDSYRIGLPRPGTWKVRFNSDWTGYSSDFDDQPGFDTATDSAPRDGMPASANIGIGRYAALVLSQDA